MVHVFMLSHKVNLVQLVLASHCILERNTKNFAKFYLGSVCLYLTPIGCKRCCAEFYISSQLMCNRFLLDSFFSIYKQGSTVSVDTEITSLSICAKTASCHAYIYEEASDFSTTLVLFFFY